MYPPTNTSYFVDHYSPNGDLFGPAAMAAAAASMQPSGHWGPESFRRELMTIQIAEEAATARRQASMYNLHRAQHHNYVPLPIVPRISSEMHAAMQFQRYINAMTPVADFNTVQISLNSDLEAPKPSNDPQPVSVFESSSAPSGSVLDAVLKTNALHTFGQASVNATTNFTPSTAFNAGNQPTTFGPSGSSSSKSSSKTSSSVRDRYARQPY